MDKWVLMKTLPAENAVTAVAFISSFWDLVLVSDFLVVGTHEVA